MFILVTMPNFAELTLLCVSISMFQQGAIGEEEGHVGRLLKRSPGWGKRDSSSNMAYLDSVLTDLSPLEGNKDDLDVQMDKRRPGWGKRSFSSEFELDKRKPGWGKRNVYDIGAFKRTPGWGKRTLERMQDLSEDGFVKRRPGWGKRSYLDDVGFEKRTPGWGKRTPGWGKRSETGEQSCADIITDIRMLRWRLAQARDELVNTCTRSSVKFGGDDIIEYAPETAE